MTPSMSTASFFIIENDDTCQVVTLDDSSTAQNQSYQAAGGCMVPWVIPGDELVLDKPPARPRLGWIVTFRWGDKLLTHRVIKTEGARFWARGDNSDAVQGPVGPEDVVGRVVAVVRAGKRIPVSGEWQRWHGLLRNYTLASARHLAAKLPGVRLFFEKQILGNERVSKHLSRLLSFAVGSITCREIADPSRKWSFLITFLKPQPRSFHRLEKEIAAGAIRAFSFDSQRPSRELGQVALYQGRFRALGKSWLVFGHSLRLVLKLAAGERCLFDQLEAKARKYGIRTIIFQLPRQAARQQALLETLGYREVTAGEESTWPKRLQALLQQHQRRYKKIIA